MNIIAETAPALIRAEADLIQEHGWYGAIDPDEAVLSHLTLVTAAVWVVAGKEAKPRDLDDTEAEHLAELVDHLERDLGCPVDVWERVHVGDSADAVAHRLRMTAIRFEHELANRPRHAAAEAPARRVSARSL